MIERDERAKEYADQAWEAEGTFHLLDSFAGMGELPYLLLLHANSKQGLPLLPYHLDLSLRATERISEILEKEREDFIAERIEDIKESPFDESFNDWWNRWNDK